MTIHRQILLVEDDNDIREVLSQILSFEGYQIVTATNGLEAWNYLQENPAPCLILLDLMMPVMTGNEFRVKQLADANLAKIPVIVISAGDDGKRTAEILSTQGYLKKPIDVDKLFGLVQEHC